MTYDELLDMRNLRYEIDELKLELDRYRNGYQGSCMTCEPVAKQNKELRKALGRALNVWSAYISVTGNTRSEEELEALKESLQLEEIDD